MLSRHSRKHLQRTRDFPKHFRLHCPHTWGPLSGKMSTWRSEYYWTESMKRTCRIASLSKTSLRTIDFVRSSFPISWHVLKWNVDFVGIDNCALWHLPLPVVYHITCSWLSYFDTILLYIMYSCFYLNCCMCSSFSELWYWSLREQSTELLTADSLGLSREIMLWFSIGSSGEIRKSGRMLEFKFPYLWTKWLWKGSGFIYPVKSHSELVGPSLCS